MVDMDFIEDVAIGEITIFLTNGVKLRGRIDKFDEESLTLTSTGNKQLVYKHAIATILKDGRDE